MDPKYILKKYFGYDAFRPGQEELIHGILSGRDALGIMPTGGGKSLCYQVPALVLPGITLVVSPLISLMQDQVLSLKAAGVSAAYINSSLSGAQMKAVYRNLLSGQYKIVYIAPERLDYGGFGELAAKLQISLLAVDEAHCISQWGQDFRPSYLRILNFVEQLPVRPVLAAFTATATRQVQEDIERILMLRDPVRVVTGFDRRNLYFEVRQPKQKQTELLKILSQRKNQSGIIYFSTRKKVEELCEYLCSVGYSATRYHAGLEEAERRQNQDDFIHDNCLIMVATNAFGMGIDKSNVSFVIHYNMPQSLEAYYQEAGRAGRDGTKADCILLFSGSDAKIAQFLIDQPPENQNLTEEQWEALHWRDIRRLNCMIDYCKTTRCLRKFILDYFGQQAPERCDNCGTCAVDYVPKDITKEAQMILSCVVRIHDKLNYYVGAATVCRVLSGSKEKKLLQLGLDHLSTYGLMMNVSRERIRDLVSHLESEGYLITEREHQTLRP
ncbi:MAG: RecQ family ATP-dependent DNA helicase, partial [Oscillospiraceae bacterium]|nr:RecQ family ATP-dependent DNA helicase [Oscillospiraceae bacterium]